MQQRTWVDETKDSAQGHWREILGALGIEVPAAHNKHCACPGCGGSDRFRFDDKNGRGTFICSAGGGEPIAGDGFRLLNHVHGWNFMESARRVADVLGIDPQRSQDVVPTLSAQIEHRHTKVTRLLQEEQEAQEKKARAKKSLDSTLSGCRPIDQVPAVWKYLTQTRGIGERYLKAAQDILAHPGLPYFYKASKTARSQNLGNYPALIGVCRSLSGDVITLHRTYVSPDGKKLALPDPNDPAETLDVRKLMTPVNDHKYRIALYQPMNGRLGVSEGLETAFSAAILNDLPCESAIDSGKLIHYAPPPTVQTLFVFADDDPAGRHGAETLKARMAIDRPEVAVHIRYPRMHQGVQPGFGGDWNDLIIAPQQNSSGNGSRPKTLKP